MPVGLAAEGGEGDGLPGGAPEEGGQEERQARGDLPGGPGHQPAHRGSSKHKYASSLLSR